MRNLIFTISLLLAFFCMTENICHANALGDSDESDETSALRHWKERYDSFAWQGVDLPKRTNLKIRIATDKPRYSLGEQISISITLENVDTEHATFLFGDWDRASPQQRSTDGREPLRHAYLKVTDKDGNRITGNRCTHFEIIDPFWSNCGNSYGINRNDFLTLKPKGFGKFPTNGDPAIMPNPGLFILSTHYRVDYVDESRVCHEIHPGKYHLKLIYRNKRTDGKELLIGDSDAKKLYLSVHEGEWESNTVNFEVVRTMWSKWWFVSEDMSAWWTRLRDKFDGWF